ncbi:hypothetical protein ACFQZ4_04930 [Catellatospora coxensis]|uniref:Uncharacterized protein n=1 Tax=Catellatospora coxensis TaxID=310354 RepID=A0A8J3L2V1_9ACTN|nr:hypothetical protein [Catellatospora coxensis]GIG10783.1 hypothetical protein Cco03nite_74830 [Catellatospora coxensis]
MAPAAQLCSGALAERHLPRALVRLRPIAAKAQNNDHQDAVRAAVRRIADKPNVRIALLSQAIDWSQEAETRIAGRVFPQALLSPDGADEVVSALLTRAASDDAALFALQFSWLRLLDDLDDAAIGQVTAAWCRVVEQDVFDRSTVQEVFGPVVHNVFGTPTCRTFTNWMSPSIRSDTLDWLTR